MQCSFQISAPSQIRYPLDNVSPNRNLITGHSMETFWYDIYKRLELKCLFRQKLRIAILPLIPLRYIDVMRSTYTDSDAPQERYIRDFLERAPFGYERVV